MAQIMHSDANAETQVLRLRFKDLRDETEESVVDVIRECEADILHEIPLKGLPEISKVYAKKYVEREVGPSGELRLSDG